MTPNLQTPSIQIVAARQLQSTRRRQLNGINVQAMNRYFSQRRQESVPRQPFAHQHHQDIFPTQAHAVLRSPAESLHCLCFSPLHESSGRPPGAPAVKNADYKASVSAKELRVLPAASALVRTVYEWVKQNGLRQQNKGAYELATMTWHS